MHQRLKAAVAPAVVAAAMSWARIARAQGAEPRSSRLDELDEVRPAAASHRHVSGVVTATSQAFDEERWIDGCPEASARAVLRGRRQCRGREGRGVRQCSQGQARCRTGRGGGGGSCSPEAIIQRESKGDPRAVNRSSGAGGKYQFMPGTWAGYGGYARAQDAPESVQDEKFQQVYAGGAGSSHWGC
jgi:Transglycosylase-like domain